MRKGNRPGIELDFPDSAFRLDLDRPFRKNESKIEGLYQICTENSKQWRFQGDRPEKEMIGWRNPPVPLSPQALSLWIDRKGRSVR
jgi:hypothetical protein